MIIRIRTNISMYVYMCVCVCLNVRVCMLFSVCVFFCVYTDILCVCVYVNNTFMWNFLHAVQDAHMV